MKIRLTSKEQKLHARIYVESGVNTRYPDEMGSAAEELMARLQKRNAIPEIRMKYFLFPEYNPKGRGHSRLDEISKHPSRCAATPFFLKLLCYFVEGPNLPLALMDEFSEAVKAGGSTVTTHDLYELCAKARTLARQYGLNRNHACEFFKLAIECEGLDVDDAWTIRAHVMKIAPRC